VRDSQHKIGQHTMESVGNPLAGRPFPAGQLRRENAPRPLVAIEPALSEQSSIDILTFGSR
jgi:hypothetical protein